MTASLSFPLPPGRALSAWRQELAAFRPHRLWLAHLLLHRVECLVRVTYPRALDSFRAALLRHLAAAAPLERLQVDRQMLGRWIDDLAADGLVEGAGGWRLTERGRRALESNAYTGAVEERRVFTFLNGGEAEQPPRYLALHGPAAALAPPADWRFDPASLDDCVRRPENWKALHGFPQDVEAFLAPPRAETRTTADWRRVILDRPEQILLVFVADGDASPPRRLGFAVRAEDWVLQTKAPALTLGEGLAEVLLPDVGGEPALEAWRAAWRAWCQQRGLPAAEVDACRVQMEEDRVEARVPRTAAARLGGDRIAAWLLAGAGRTRVAAPLEIVVDAE